MEIEYKILSDSAASHLTASVQEKLNEGWELLGAPYVMSCGNAMYHYQAMIKKAKPQPVRGTYRAFDDDWINKEIP